MKDKNFIVQKDNFSCGPVAVANILKLVGFDIKKSLVKELRFPLQVSTKYGTEERQILGYLELFRIASKQVFHIPKSPKTVYLALMPLEGDVYHYVVIYGSLVLNYAAKVADECRHVNLSNKRINKMLQGAQIWRLYNK